MSGTAELIRDYYAAFNAGDWDAMLDKLADDVRHEVNQGPTRTGRDAFRTFLNEMDDCFDERIEDLEVLVSEDGTRAAAEFMVEGRYTATAPDLPEANGQRYRLRAGCFFEVEDERIRRLTTYYNLEDWMRQVAE